jgi:hypothetical protein
MNGGNLPFESYRNKINIVQSTDNEISSFVRIDATCYMVATLYSLMAMTELTDIIFNPKTKENVLENIKGNKIHYASNYSQTLTAMYECILKNYFQKNKVLIKPTKICKALHFFSQQYESTLCDGEFNDSELVFRVIFDVINSEININCEKINIKNDILSDAKTYVTTTINALKDWNKNCLLSNFFNVVSCTYKTCIHCKSILKVPDINSNGINITKFQGFKLNDAYNNMYLNFPVDNLYTSLDNNMISYFSHDWRCTVCGKMGCHSSTYYIQLPKILKFITNCDTSVRKDPDIIPDLTISDLLSPTKLNDTMKRRSSCRTVPMNFPIKDLDMTKYLDPNCRVATHYSLFATIKFTGAHYYATIKMNDVWYNCNDDNVVRLEGTQEYIENHYISDQSNGAYSRMLLYRKI